MGLFPLLIRSRLGIKQVSSRKRASTKQEYYDNFKQRMRKICIYWIRADIFYECLVLPRLVT